MRDSLENEIPHIKFNDVSFSYPGEKENLISKCNFSIKKPGLWMVVGKNGSGKSTLLKLINGIIKPKMVSLTLKQILAWCCKILMIKY